MSLAVPLRLSRERVLLYGAVLAVLASSPFMLFPSWFHDVAFRGDFANFWSAGANVGTRALLDPAQLATWQTAHHITPQFFVYPPAFAWFYAPFSLLAPMQGMVLAEAIMLVALALAGAIAARLYGFSLWFALVAAFAWAPSVNALELGQNTTLGLMLTLAASWALVERRVLVAGIATGLLLYKPSIALPFVVLLCARAQWRALAIVAASSACWYLASVAATHGDWTWPSEYVRLVIGSNASEFAGNAHKAFTVPTLLRALGAPWLVAAGASAAVFLAALPLLARAPTIEAVSMAPAIGLAASIHSWPYEAALLFPALCYAMIRLAEPLRTQVVAVAYLVVAFAIAAPYGGHALAIPCIGAAGWWIWSGYFKEGRYAYSAQHVR